MKTELKNKVIMIGDPQDVEEKPIQLTHYLSTSDWQPTDGSNFIQNCEQIVYMGHDKLDGDMFAVYMVDNSIIEICKGHLNSGKY